MLDAIRLINDEDIVYFMATATGSYDFGYVTTYQCHK